MEPSSQSSDAHLKSLRENVGLTLSENLLGILLVFSVDYKISELIITDMSLVFQRSSVCLIDLFFLFQFIRIHKYCFS